MLAAGCRRSRQTPCAPATSRHRVMLGRRLRAAGVYGRQRIGSPGSAPRAAPRRGADANGSATSGRTAAGAGSSSRRRSAGNRGFSSQRAQRLVREIMQVLEDQKPSHQTGGKRRLPRCGGTHGAEATPRKAKSTSPSSRTSRCPGSMLASRDGRKGPSWRSLRGLLVAPPRTPITKPRKTGIPNRRKIPRRTPSS